MSTYAELNTDNIVINVIIADAEFVATQTKKDDGDGSSGVASVV